MLDTCLSIRAHELRDTAASRPQDPLSDVAIISYTNKEVESSDEEGMREWKGGESGMLDIVEARMKGVKLLSRKIRYPEGQRRQIERLQERLNKYLIAARYWTPEKSAKVTSDLQCRNAAIVPRQEELNVSGWLKAVRNWNALRNISLQHLNGNLTGRH